MADLLKEYKRQEIEWTLKIHSDPPVSYASSQAAEQYDFICSVDIPWPFLKRWNELLKGNASSSEVNYVDLLNATVVDGWFALKRDNKRIDESLRIHSCTVKKTYKKTNGRKRMALDRKVYSLSVRRGELESVESLKTEASKSYKELEEFRKMYTDLANKNRKMQEEMKNLKGE